MKIRGIAKTIFIAGSILGFTLAAFMLGAAWKHNPQGEFFSEETGIEWIHCGTLFFLWFTIAAAPSLLLAGGLLVFDFFQTSGRRGTVPSDSGFDP